jgi:hypothetical protein
MSGVIEVYQEEASGKWRVVHRGVRLHHQYDTEDAARRAAQSIHLLVEKIASIPEDDPAPQT